MRLPSSLTEPISIGTSREIAGAPSKNDRIATTRPSTVGPQATRGADPGGGIGPADAQGWALSRFHGIEVVHDDNHGFGLLLGDQVVHDDVDVALNVPPLLVFSPAVEEIQHRVFRFGIRVVVRRRVDVGTPPPPCHFGKVPALPHLPARHVLQGVEVAVRFGNLDAAVVEAGSEERPRCRICDDGAIDGQRVVVEPHYLLRGRDVP